MRELIFKTRMNRNTKQVVHAIAWATNRRGRIVWKDSDSVSSKLLRYFDVHNVYLPTVHATKQVTYVLNRIIDEGLASAKLADDGRILEFGFNEDVNISGYTPVLRDDIAGMVRLGYNPTPKSLKEEPNVEAPVHAAPPLPEIPRPRFLASEITTLLDQWAEKDVDAYADWAEKLCRSLEVIVHG